MPSSTEYSLVLARAGGRCPYCSTIVLVSYDSLVALEPCVHYIDSERKDGMVYLRFVKT